MKSNIHKMNSIANIVKTIEGIKIPKCDRQASHLFKLAESGEVADKVNVMRAFTVRDLLQESPNSWTLEYFYELYGNLCEDEENEEKRLTVIAAHLSEEQMASFFGY